jgi:hypothetical protein
MKPSDAVKPEMEFGRLTVIAKVPGSGSLWECKCACGNVVRRTSSKLFRHHTQSCGCLKVDTAAKMNFIHGETHHTRLNQIWQGMIYRCRSNHPDYGGRGIRVEEVAWRTDYIAFRDWALAHGYADNLTIDRKDNNRGYSPDNCQWVPNLINAKNKRNTIGMVIDGIWDTVNGWFSSPLCEIGSSVLYRRYHRGWPHNWTILKQPLGDGGSGGPNRAQFNAQADYAILFGMI